MPMTDYPHRVHVEAVRWLELAPGLRLFRSLHQSLTPSRMFLALLLVVLMYLGGKALDFVWGDRVYHNEVYNYQHFEPARYDRFLELQARNTNAVRQPIFQTLVGYELAHFNAMVDDAVSLNFGLTGLLDGRRDGVIAEIRMMVVTLPGWLIRTHPGFTAVFGLYAFVLTMLLGGAIARLAAMDACRGLHGSPFVALRFTALKAGWLIAAPLLPLALVVLIAAVLALCGLVFFNLPVLDVVGGLLFGVLLVLGSIAAVLLLGLAFSCNLLVPAVAVEDADAFDSVSRSFSYVLAHPWRYILYLGVTVVYGAIGYLVVGLVLFATIWATKTFTSLLVFTDAAEGLNRFDAILPDPQLGQVTHEPAAGELGASGKVAATLVGVWIKLVVAMLPAYCVSFYFTAMTWVYLLMRYHTDGAAFDELALRNEQPAQLTVPDKIEPAPDSQSSSPDAD